VAVVTLVAAIVAAFALTGCAGGGRVRARSGCDSRTAETTASEDATATGGKNVKTIYLAGGCFWGLEKYVGLVHGVINAESGYANGRSDNARYGDGSGYAEVVKVDYDPAEAPLPFLLGLYYDAIDPTTLNRQGNDVGVEYRSGIYYTDPADSPIIEASLAKLQTQYDKPIAVETGPLKNYARAEDYHQQYLQKNPGGYCHIPLNLFKQAAAARPDPSEFPAAR
jgi:peptide methionine sulfoxide reductase msrA/msrB